MEFLITVKVTAKDEDALPDWGLGKGILGKVTLTYEDVDEIPEKESLDYFYLQRSIDEAASEFLETLVEIKAVPIEKTEEEE